MALNTEYAKTLHRHVIIWLDQYIGELGENEKMKDHFRRVTYPLHTFTNVQPTIDFIQQQQAAQRTVFLIVSGTFAREIVPAIYDLNYVKQIFIYCAKIRDHIVWAEDYIEKVLMFDFDEELLIRLTNEIANYFTDEANRYDREGQTERAVGLLDWADWLYNDADTMQQEACRKIRQTIR